MTEITKELTDYIASWIVSEVEEYHGTTIYDQDVDTPLSECNVREWSDLNEEVLQMMIEKSIEAYEGGARNEL